MIRKYIIIYNKPCLSIRKPDNVEKDVIAKNCIFDKKLNIFILTLFVGGAKIYVKWWGAFKALLCSLG